MLDKLGNIGTLSPDEQLQRVNTILGKVIAIKKVNIHQLAVLVMLLLRVGIEMEKVFDETVTSSLHLQAMKSLSTESTKELQQKQEELIIEDESNLEKMEITIDQSY
ncbi:hypothetical protein RclHR1_05070016 [Rhizophagus clarus]|uniref:Uncharacterized protein n=1 Tax=Rhizophagus clarus TaxID=94130 RepID=A0A2Z6S3X2_9GLOM|nr:hypothetical protein RclHR1_05070016 [Rhizophagus clarus]GES86369.1 hypothetical protein RCL_jg18482.t1 [Rhizophagus clarus]